MDWMGRMGSIKLHSQLSLSGSRLSSSPGTVMGQRGNIPLVLLLKSVMPTFLERDWKSIISLISAYVVQDMLLHGCNFNSMWMPFQAVVKFCIILPRMLCFLTENWEFITSASEPAIQKILYRNKTLHIDMAGLTWLFISFLQGTYNISQVCTILTCYQFLRILETRVRVHCALQELLSILLRQLWPWRICFQISECQE